MLNTLTKFERERLHVVLEKLGPVVPLPLKSGKLFVKDMEIVVCAVVKSNL